MREVVDYAVAALTQPGQDECGDLSLVKQFAGGVLIGVVDGLGHGPQAAAAARTAINTLELHASEAVEVLVDRCHLALKGTRGVVMSLASIDTSSDTLTWVGVGNVEAVLFHADSEDYLNRHWLLLRGGVVGYELPTIRPSRAAIGRNDLLLFATDGVRSGFGEKLPLDEPPQRIAPRKIADFIMSGFGRGTDDALVLAARYLGMSS